MIEELNRLKEKWNSSEAKNRIASIQLVHMIEANINQFELLINWIIEKKAAAISESVPYFVPTDFDEHEPFGAKMQTWFSTITALSTLFYSVFMTSRSATDNMYRLHIELNLPGDKWGKWTSIKNGLKKDHFTELFDDIENFQNDFNRMRWIRNCYKSGAYCSSGGLEKNGELFLSLLMTEQDENVVDTSERITESDLKAAIQLCSRVLHAITKSN